VETTNTLRQAITAFVTVSTVGKKISKKVIDGGVVFAVLYMG
jgi:hypothetical protein